MISSKFLEYYESEINKRKYLIDKGQRNVIGYLDQSIDFWTQWQKQQDEIFPLLKSKLPTPRGVYIWGGVGRGKTFLMDVFFSFIPVKKKIRIHFHEFMKKIHSEMYQLKDQVNPLLFISKKIAKKYNLICFDEFHVSDIADAMILDRLLKGLHNYNVGFVMTSNYSPDDLYPDGLHRNELLPAIQLIKKISEVKRIPQGVDHRRNRSDEDFIHLTKNRSRINSHYQYPLNSDSNLAMQRFFNIYTDGLHNSNEKISINGRELNYIAKSKKLIWIDFKDLCSDFRSHNDYLSLCEVFSTIMVSNVPLLNDEKISSAKRFTWLVDVLYDQKIRFVVSAEVSPDELYKCKLMEQESERTVSRLIEMQSDF